MKAFGSKPPASGAFVSPRASGSATLSNRPPPVAALAFKNLRRETLCGEWVAVEFSTGSI
jgi:hypothetical protein